MSKRFTALRKLKPGDQVGIISPSAGLPAMFPWVQDLGLERLKQVFELRPKEYSTTRQLHSTLKDRARDIMTAFGEPANKAVIASIGGDDQIKLLKYLDPQVFMHNPKPFFGYSDNTHLIDYLWQLGIPSYYGGSIMTQYSMQGGMHDLTVEFLRHAFFDSGEYELPTARVFNDEGLDWADPENLNKARKLEANDGWFWDGQHDAVGKLWGGCVESLVVQFAADSYLPKLEELEDSVLFLETAEDIPDPWLIEYVLSGMGERGWLNQFRAVLIGRPKAWEFDKPRDEEDKENYRKEQREAVLHTVRQYNHHIPVVQNLDFGHTDPQICLPVGNQVRLDSTNQKIFATY